MVSQYDTQAGGENQRKNYYEIYIKKVWTSLYK